MRGEKEHMGESKRTRHKNCEKKIGQKINIEQMERQFPNLKKDQ